MPATGGRGYISHDFAHRLEPGSATSDEEGALP
jgi:hypothetical protein